MPKPSRLQRAVVLLIVLVAAFQVFAVTTAAIPTNKVSTALQPMRSYLDPFFTQDWRLFAPNPISEDRDIWFRGEYVDASGTTTTTPWFDWSAVEVQVIHHNLVGGRAGYITNKAVGPLNNAYFGLTLEQRAIADSDKATALKGYSDLREALTRGVGNSSAIDEFVRFEESAAELGTSVLEGLYPGKTFTAVRYRIVQTPVVPFEDRTLTATAGQSHQSQPTVRESGWRRPILGTKAERDAVAGFLRRHR